MKWNFCDAYHMICLVIVLVYRALSYAELLPNNCFKHMHDCQSKVYEP